MTAATTSTFVALASTGFVDTLETGEVTDFAGGEGFGGVVTMGGGSTCL